MEHCNLFHVMRKRLSVLFLLIAMFKGQHFSMDGIQRGYFFFSQIWCTVELLHKRPPWGQEKVAVLERFEQA